jgi:hypothetical protein
MWLASAKGLKKQCNGKACPVEHPDMLQMLKYTYGMVITCRSKSGVIPA